MLALQVLSVRDLNYAAGALTTITTQLTTPTVTDTSRVAIILAHNKTYGTQLCGTCGLSTFFRLPALFGASSSAAGEEELLLFRSITKHRNQWDRK